MRKALSLVAAMTMAMVALNVPAASAATSVTFQPQTVLGPGVPKDGTSDQNVVALGEVTFDTTATQTAQLVSVMRVNDVTIRSLFDNEIVCKWAGGSKNVVLGQNVYQRGSGKPQFEDLTLTTSQLVHPGVATRVTCTAFIRTASLGWDDSTLRLVSGSLKAVVFAGKAIQASTPPGLYKVDAANPVVRQPLLPLSDVPADTQSLDVVADAEYMICHTTGQCDKTKTSKASFTLIVNQWKADGTLCQSDTSTSVVLDTPYWVHHVVVPLKKSGLVVRKDCAPRFNAYVLVKWLGGETGAVQGVATGLTDSRRSEAKHNSDMSSVHVIPNRLS
ncbi:hypothetical protein FXN61_31340 [Lentzea sp. PSKA42]|uniref:Ig-like domain-containing protein n=1 Tax=Lentzea indica TaxID=2604800 RepID=A0ABX1FQ05_9PSEU|nr:hypothetical protein [Lentzea indica]NKE61037.1 hypothetical protein [Lentzea indica]